MGQIITDKPISTRCNLEAIQSGGSKANIVLANGEIWLVDTTNASKGTNGFGLYDSYIKGDGNTIASALTVQNIDSGIAIDSSVTQGSNNAVSGDAVYTAIQAIDVSSQISGKADKAEMSVVAGTGANADKTTITLKQGTSATVLTSHQSLSGKQDTLTFDNTPTANSTNPVTSGGVKTALDTKANSNTTYTKTEVNNLIIPAGFEAEWVTTLPASGTANTIYCVQGTTSFTAYGWDGTQFVEMAEYDWIVDATPTKESSNAVSSGGVYDSIGVVSDYVFGSSALVELKIDTIQLQAGYWYSSSNWNSAIYDVTPYAGGSVTVGISTRNNIKQYQIVKNYKTITDSSDASYSTDNLLKAGSNTSGTSANFTETTISLSDTNIVSQASVGRVYLIVCVHSSYTPTSLVLQESIADKLAKKQDNLTFDSVPTNGSNNPVTSGGIFSAIKNVDDKTKVTVEYDSGDVVWTEWKYYNTHSKAVGSSAPELSTKQSTFAIASATFQMKKGHTYVVSSISNTSSDYGRPVTFVENGLIVAIATANDAVTTPIEYTAQKDGTIYINCVIANYSDFYIKDSISVADLAGNIETENTYPLVFLPKKMYGVVNETQQLFYRGIVRKRNPYDIFLLVSAAGFKSMPRYTQVTPSATGTTNVSVKLIDDEYKESLAISSQLIVKQAPASASSMNVLCLGDSTTGNTNCFPIELKRRLCDSGGTPAGLGLSSINFVGRKNVMGSSIKCEGNGGWTWARFTTAGTQQIRFTLTSATTGYIGAIYSFTSSNGTIQVQLAEWNVTEGDGNALFDYVNNADAGKYPTTQSGTLTYVSGASEPATNLSFTEYLVEAANPFWHNGALDIQYYADTYCNGSIDVLICNFFGTFNAGVVGNSSVASVIAQMKTFIDAYHTAFPSGKVILNSTQPPNQYYGIEYNYGGTNVRNTWSVLWNCFKWSMALDEFCNDADYSSFCYYSNSLAEVDSEYAYPTTQRDVNSRVSTSTETIGTNGVHTNANGSKMTADAIFRCFVCNILN